MLSVLTGTEDITLTSKFKIKVLQSKGSIGNAFRSVPVVIRRFYVAETFAPIMYPKKPQGRQARHYSARKRERKKLVFLHILHTALNSM